MWIKIVASGLVMAGTALLSYQKGKRDGGGGGDNSESFIESLERYIESLEKMIALYEAREGISESQKSVYVRLLKSAEELKERSEKNYKNLSKQTEEDRQYKKDVIGNLVQILKSGETDEDIQRVSDILQSVFGPFENTGRDSSAEQAKSPADEPITPVDYPRSYNPERTEEEAKEDKSE